METPDNTATNNPRTWLLHHCTTPGCTAVIRALPGQQPPDGRCRWCRGGSAYNLNQIETRPGNGPLLSKEEFGTDLFDAIRLQSAMRQAERTATVYKAKGLTTRAREAQDQAAARLRELKAILNKNTIDGPDLDRLLAI